MNVDSFLWHGTSGKIAERILSEDVGIVPNGTESFSLRVSEAGTNGAKRVDPALVYLMKTLPMAIPFGWTRTVGRVVRGHLKFDKRSDDTVAVFGIERDVLQSSLLARGKAYPLCEFTHRGIIPAAALRHVIYFPQSPELKTFALDAINGRLDSYIGIEVVSFLHGKACDLVEE